ncbi:C3 and PZP-like alpha-2-macroglobulin domain-containing protein 8 [Corticium candelabrum]|uniref:C3 and PZP-like alpha-2-macroglobulin domain-containing protein 8 n=1 Tax=Corticium candelabrum TaxID=121492 RepID=UPI002E25789B|nr:C3 and PZP-like alpha-2-macroglobulin domain-containing protein 8 [Corticium candelabrum]
MNLQLLTILCLMFSCRLTVGSDSYIVIAPKTIRPGLNVRISVTILQASSNVQVQTDVIANRTGTQVTASKTISPGASGFIELQMPNRLLDEDGPYSLRVTGSGGLTFRNETSLKVDQKCVSVFIQTDKGIYKPGQTILMRFIAYKPTLLPYTGTVEVSITDPNDNLMAKWKDVSLNSGVASRDFPLSIEPPLGEWVISVSGECLTGKQTFQVDKYVLPKFEVTVKPPSFLVSSDTSVEGTITAKYTYGQPVKGTLELTFYLPTQYYNKPPKTLRMSNIQINGMKPFVLDSSKIRSLQEDHYIDRNEDNLPSWGQLAINASVTETLTGTTLSGQGLTTFYSHSIKMKFHESTPDTFKPGLSFVARILVTTQDNKPMEGISVTITAMTNNGSTPFVVQVIGGIAVLIYDVPTGATRLSLNAECKDPRTGNKVTAYSNPSISKSPSSSFIQLSTSTSSAQIGTSLNYGVKSTFAFSKLYYQVMARGNLIVHNLKQLDSSATSTSLDVPVTHAMAPSAQIVAYVITGDGEVVADSLSVSVAIGFENSVNVSFGVTEKKPGDDVTVTVKATPDSFVAVAAVDYSVALLADTNDITQAHVVDELQSYDTSTPDWNDGPVWAFRREKRSIWWPWSPGGQDAYSIFDKAGVVVLTDTTLYKEKQQYHYRFGCPDCAVPLFNERAGIVPEMALDLADGDSAPATGELLEPERTRTFFPETWLWSDAVTGANGMTTFTSKVPDTITTWVASGFAVNSRTGLGVPATRAELKAFQPFFVSLNLPYSVRRGEQLGLKVTVFNYLDVDINNVLVELEENKDLVSVSYNILTNEAELVNTPEPLTLSKSISVTANSGTTVVFAVTPRTVGQIVIKVIARSSVAADAVERQLLVVPEGRAVDYTQNVLIQMDQSDQSYKQSLSLTLPSDVIRDSGRATVSVIGDLMGPTLNNLERLVRMPYGCGEQNAASTAPNIFVRQYLDATGQLTLDLKSKTNKYMMTGYQRELNYRHNDGSYSAWGGRDDSGSLWLTAFVVKLYALASDFVTIDSQQVQLSTRWIAKKQLPSGVFPTVGRLVDTYIKGGLDGETANTAFVLISLIETRDAANVNGAPAVSGAITKAQGYLEGKLISTSRHYTICIMAYALALSGSSMTSQAITKLKSIATVDGGVMYWKESGGSSRKSSNDDFFYYPYHAPSAEIEMTGYGLLAITQVSDIPGGLPAAKWLSQQRNSLGGWSSTQDTCVALQALANYAAALRQGSGSLNIHLTSDVDLDFSHVVSVDSDNALVLQQAEVPVGGNLNLNVNGSGTALLQATVAYNVPAHGSSEPSYLLVVDVLEKNAGDRIDITLCSTYKKDEDSGMVVVSSVLPSGFGVDHDSMETYMKSDSDVKRYDVSGDQVDIYLNQLVYNSKKCVVVTANRQYDVGNVKPVPAVVYSYYEPDLEKESVLYAPLSMADATVCELCMCNENCAGCDDYKKTIGCPTQNPPSSSTSVSSITLITVLMTLVGMMMRSLLE